MVKETGVNDRDGLVVLRIETWTYPFRIELSQYPSQSDLNVIVDSTGNKVNGIINKHTERERERRKLVRKDFPYKLRSRYTTPDRPVDRG